MKKVVLERAKEGASRLGLLGTKLNLSPEEKREAWEFVGQAVHEKQVELGTIKSDGNGGWISEAASKGSGMADWCREVFNGTPHLKLRRAAEFYRRREEVSCSLVNKKIPPNWSSPHKILQFLGKEMTADEVNKVCRGNQDPASLPEKTVEGRYRRAAEERGVPVQTVICEDLQRVMYFLQKMTVEDVRGKSVNEARSLEEQRELFDQILGKTAKGHMRGHVMKQKAYDDGTFSLEFSPHKERVRNPVRVRLEVSFDGD